MGLKITVSGHAFAQFAEKLAALGDERAKRAISDALNKTGDKGRTQIKRALSAQSGIKYGQIDKSMRTLRSTPATLKYELQQSGDETNITSFSGRQLAAGFVAKPWSKQHLFAGSFQIKKFGGKVFHRVGGARSGWGERRHGLPIKEIYGPNLAREIVKDAPKHKFEEMPAQLAPAIQAQLKRYIP